MTELCSKGNRVLKLHPQDTVAVVLENTGIEAGSQIEIDGKTIQVRERIPRGHKIAVKAMESNDWVMKFGHPIGTARRPISPGEPVHTHNLVYVKPDESNAYPSNEMVISVNPTRIESPSHFQGYRRPTGFAGVRNYIVVVASVNCSASVVKAIARNFIGSESLELEKKGIHGVIPITHSSGCAQAIGGEGYQVLNRTLAGWIFHPNVVGALIVGLGCEGTTFQSILESATNRRQSDLPIEKIGIQALGGTESTIAAGIDRVKSIIERLPGFHRESLPVSELGIALNCGGSDGLSGLTANPVLGSLSDHWVSQGGRVALAEIPECHGAESLLESRCLRSDVKKKLRETFEWWQRYAEKNAIDLNENLAPGNLAGGITTILEKSLGAVAKAGTSPLQDVVDYAEQVSRSGFTLMNTPGFDPVSVTGLVAGGCQLVAFTTGRGSTYGCGIAPTIKISSNSELFKRMSGDMDFDAGRAATGVPIHACSQELFDLMVQVASGHKTWSEKLGMGWEEFVPWPLGETL